MNNIDITEVPVSLGIAHRYVTILIPITKQDRYDELSRAQALRWHEEVLLLKEEMRRVLAYFEYKALWWIERGDAEGREVSPALAERLRAYAEGQAKLQRDLASKFNDKWSTLFDVESGNGDLVAAESDDELDGVDDQ
jgi:hypothetical protein